MKKIIFLMAALFQCLMSGNQSAFGATVTRPYDNTIRIDGILDGTTAAEVKSFFDSKVTRIEIRSEGGRTDTGLEIGRLIRSHSLDVEVFDYCISSCANYIFLSGRTKTTRLRSIVVWHGGLNGLRARQEPPQASMNDRQKELLLLLNEGISADIIIFSGLLTVGHPTDQTRKVEIDGSTIESPVLQQEYQGWMPSKDELIRLGVKNIGQFWEPGNQSEIDEALKDFGFEPMKIFRGRANSYVPSSLRR